MKLGLATASVWNAQFLRAGPPPAQSLREAGAHLNGLDSPLKGSQLVMVTRTRKKQHKHRSPGTPRTETSRKGSLSGSHGSLLSHTAEYALRAMAAIAASPPNVAARARDLAIETQVPVHYLSKVLRRLVEADLLVSQKGHQGGFRLARPASRIRFSEILAAMDPSSNERHCAFGWPVCDPKAPCPLHDSWAQLNDAFHEWARRSTLADVRLHRSSRLPLAPRRARAR